MKKINLFNCTFSELEKIFEELHYPKFRAKQLADWFYKKLVFDFNLMLNLPAGLREQLSNQFDLYLPTIEHVAHSQVDNSYKFLLKTDDGKQIESILMLGSKGVLCQEEEGEVVPRDRATICVSCMVGCPLGCKFCATGSQVGFVRKLSCAEIVGQVLVILAYAQEKGYAQKISNIVFMGMGEPFLNIKAVEKSIALFTSTDCFSLSPARIAVSTAGVGPGIAKFIAETGVRLAVSLHFPTDELRSKYMPVNRQFSLSELVTELKKVKLKKRDSILIEYLMLDGINDSLVQAKQLQKLVSNLKVKINLIPYNPIKSFRAKASSDEVIKTFATYLKSKGLFTSIRSSKGIDIDGGCGQFSLSR